MVTGWLQGGRSLGQGAGGCDRTGSVQVGGVQGLQQAPRQGVMQPSAKALSPLTDPISDYYGGRYVGPGRGGLEGT